MAGSVTPDFEEDAEMEEYNHLEIRCPRLGGEVTFSYCRQEGGSQPCPRIIICWYPYFPVEQYLRGTMSEEAWHRFISHTPKDKILTLVELVEEAKKRVRQKSD